MTIQRILAGLVLALVTIALIAPVTPDALAADTDNPKKGEKRKALLKKLLEEKKAAAAANQANNTPKESTKPPDDSCVKACAKAGAPLGIITEDGTIYNVISHNMPDFDERAKLVPYVAKTVHASGRVFERNGAHAIAIDKIEVVGK